MDFSYLLARRAVEGISGRGGISFRSENGVETPPAKKWIFFNGLPTNRLQKNRLDVREMLGKL
jgi:hypothetical protein